MFIWKIHFVHECNLQYVFCEVNNCNVTTCVAGKMYLFVFLFYLIDLERAIIVFRSSVSCRLKCPDLEQMSGTQR